jgi:hypothetical protein
MTTAALLSANCGEGLADLGQRGGLSTISLSRYQTPATTRSTGCGWWIRHVWLSWVAPDPRLDSPLRTPLNLHDETTSKTKRSRNVY